jgi:hypothetical protein
MEVWTGPPAQLTGSDHQLCYRVVESSGIAKKIDEKSQKAREVRRRADPAVILSLLPILSLPPRDAPNEAKRRFV